MQYYEKSIQAIKDLDRIPSSREWNKIAKEYNFLSVRTLLTLSNKSSFYELCKSIRKRTN